MFSMFFGKKKNSPDTVDDDDPIPGPDTNPSSDQNEYVFVDQKNNPSSGQQTNSIYPPMPGMPYPPAFGHHPHQQHIPTHSTVIPPVNFLENVPFQLAPELCKEDTLEIVQLEVDGILALMTKRLQFDQVDYDFSLEREIAQQ